MRATKFLAAAATAMIAGFATLPAHAVSLIQDGGFDTPLSPGTFTTYNSGQSFGAGNVWTVTQGSVDEIGNYWQAPPLGGGSVDLSGNSPGAIRQSFNAAAGTYSLQFYLSGNPDGGLGTKQVTVDVGGTIQDFFYTLGSGNSRSNMDFILETLVFQSAGGSNLLSFASDTDSAFGGVIGGVSVSAIPEPATWALMLLGFGGIGLVMRRRQAGALAV